MQKFHEASLIWDFVGSSLFINLGIIHCLVTQSGKTGAGMLVVVHVVTFVISVTI